MFLPIIRNSDGTYYVALSVWVERENDCSCTMYNHQMNPHDPLLLDDGGNSPWVNLIFLFSFLTFFKTGMYLYYENYAYNDTTLDIYCRNWCASNNKDKKWNPIVWSKLRTRYTLNLSCFFPLFHLRYDSPQFFLFWRKVLCTGDFKRIYEEIWMHNLELLFRQTFECYCGWFRRD